MVPLGGRADRRACELLGGESSDCARACYIGGIRSVLQSKELVLVILLILGDGVSIRSQLRVLVVNLLLILTPSVLLVGHVRRRRGDLTQLGVGDSARVADSVAALVVLSRGSGLALAVLLLLGGWLLGISAGWAATHEGGRAALEGYHAAAVLGVLDHPSVLRGLLVLRLTGSTAVRGTCPLTAPPFPLALGWCIRGVREAHLRGSCRPELSLAAAVRRVGCGGGWRHLGRLRYVGLGSSLVHVPRVWRLLAISLSH